MPDPVAPRTLAELQRGAAAAPSPPELPLAVTRTRTFDTPEFRGMRFLEVEARSALNRVRGMPFKWSINPYRGCSHACSYCFARPTHTYLNLDPLGDFDATLVVKTNIAEVLRRELARRSWIGEHVAMGTNTDPYQRCEGRYQLMPEIIAALADSLTPFSILTKGTLITRDLDRLVEAATRVDVRAAFTVGMLDEKLWRAAEPGTPPPSARLEAVRALTEAGIPTGVMLAPIMPGLNDQPERLADLVEAAAAAGATHVTPIVLHLRPGVRELFLPWLEREHPGLVTRYQALYRRSTATPEYRDPVERFVREQWRARTRGRRAAPQGVRARGRRPSSSPRSGTGGEQLGLL